MTYSPFDLSGKVALITGGNRGIGLGMAEALAQAGCDVAIWGRDPVRNEEAAQALGEQGVRARGYVVDVSDEAAVIAGMAETIVDFGRLDCVFVNAGISGGATPFTETTTAFYRAIMAINLDGAFWTLREAAKHMAARAESGDPGGSLVVVSSMAALIGAPRLEVYSATKGALVAMVRAIAVEYAKHGVRANAILPGWIATEMTASRQSSKPFSDAMLQRVPMKRWGEPGDFGGVAVYLASDASSFHTGAEFVIDGGYTIG